MAIDPTIPLQVNPPPDFLTQQSKMLSLRDMAMRFKQEQAAAQAQNALRQIFANPANLDEKTGFPTSSAMSQIMAIDPTTGMQLRQNQLKTEQMQLAISGQKSDLQQKFVQMSQEEVREPSLIAYEEAKKAGFSETAAQAAGQRAYSDGLEKLRSSGLVSPDLMAMVPSDFNYQRVKSRSMQYKDYLAQQQKGTPEEQALAQFRKENPNASAAQERDFIVSMKREERGAGEQGWVVLTDPTNKDKEGNPTQYRYNPRSAQATTLDGRPYTPSGAAKLSAGGSSGSIEPENLDYFAENYRKTGKLPPMYRDQASRAAIMNRAAELARGEGKGAGEDLAGQSDVKASQASLTALTKQRDAVSAFEQNAIRNGEKLKTLATQVDTTGVPVIERWIRGGRRSVAGDPLVSQFDAQMQVYRTEAAKVLTNPNLTGQLTDTARQEVAEFLGGNMSARGIVGVVDLLKSDFDNRAKTLDEQIATVRGRISGKGGGGSPSPSPQPSNAGAAGGIVTTNTEADYNALASGTKYRMPNDPAGKYRVKP